MDVHERAQAHDWERGITDEGREAIFISPKLVKTIGHRSMYELGKELTDAGTFPPIPEDVAERYRQEGREQIMDSLRPVFEQIGRDTGRLETRRVKLL